MNTRRMIYALHSVLLIVVTVFPSWNIWLGQKCSSTVSPVGADLGHHFLFDFSFFAHANPNFGSVALYWFAISLSAIVMISVARKFEPEIAVRNGDR